MSDQPDQPPIRLTHLDDAGAARMVDVTAKAPTVRTASATAFVACAPGVVAALRRRLSGIAMPTYIVEIPGGDGKIPVGELTSTQEAELRASGIY